MDLTQLTNGILSVNDWVWQPFAMPLVLVIVGGFLTVMTGFVQIRRFPVALRMVMKGAFQKQEKGSKTITPFQALSTALASTTPGQQLALTVHRGNGSEIVLITLGS